MPPPIWSAQVGDDGGDEDQRHQQHRDIGAEVYRLDDGVGALALQLTQLIQSGDDQSAQRQQVQHPRVGQPYLRGVVDAQVEQCAHHAADAAHQTAHYDPFQQRRRVGLHMTDVFPQLLHPVSPPFRCYLQVRIVSCFAAAVKPPKGGRLSLCETENLLVFLTYFHFPC